MSRNALRVLVAFLWASLTGLVVFPSLVVAQGVLVDVRTDHRYRLPRPIIRPPHTVPRPIPQSYKVQEFSVHATLDDQVAKVQVTQSFVNTGSRQMEVSFVFPLPYDGAVDSMTLMVDGKEYAAQLLNAQQARSVYEGYIRRNQDPALLEWMGTGMFKTSVFPIPPGAKRTVTIQYSQICRKFEGLTDWVFPLSTAKFTSHPVETVGLDVTVRSQVPIKNVYSPSHSVKIKRPSKTTARITYTGHNEIPSSDFRLLYDIGKRKVAASLLTYRPDKNDEGYFLLLVSPDIERSEKKAMRKTVVFVVDRSGSMTGKKIDQAKGALQFVLNNLHEGDLFNIVAYDSSIESFRPELQRYNDKTRDQALGFVEGLYAGGSTNIDGALHTALDQLKDDRNPNYIVFLTDGLPTAGERKESKIVDNARSANQVRARIFSFGVGHDVNSRLLDRLSRSCFGQSQYVRPNEDIEEHVSKLYRRIGTPVMVNLKIAVDLDDGQSENGPPISRVYPRDEYDLFAGDQLVMVGRYKRSGPAKITISGTVDGKKQSFQFPGKLVKHSNDDSQAFIEKLWAIRRVGEIIDEIDLHGKNSELVNELVALATHHGILTPYTSFLADDRVNVRDLAENAVRADRELLSLQQQSGGSAFGQRLAKSDMKRAQLAAPSNSADQFGFRFGSPAGAQAGSGAGAAMPGAGAGASAAAPGGRAAGGVLRRGRQTATQPAADATEGKTSSRRILNVGKKTFYWTKDRWADSQLTDSLEKKAIKIKRFSKEYFDLVKVHGSTLAKYLSVDEPVTLVLDKQAYVFE